ncbi:MAG: Na+/H+ antiporter NhaA [Gallionella sp.]|nr:Na+/H+ antiporter NhaA [Gallionella sp.]
MTEQNIPKKSALKGIFYAPWERTFDKILSPFEDFIHRETTSGLLLMGAAIIALILANSFMADTYLHVLHTHMGISVGSWEIDMSLHHWVNDGLMTLFFFVVGMELKREILVGELADLRQAALPIVAAIGGMVMPALIYLAVNHGGDAARGWGVPMATDIAFAVGVLVLLAGRVPKSLITFLVALAIADDLGAVLVIALFYTQQLALDWLAGSGLLVALLFFLNYVGVRRPLPYFAVTTLLWYALLQSGVHATLAGVLCAFAIPAKPKYDPRLFSVRVKELIGRFDSHHPEDANIMTNEKLHSVVQTLEHGVHSVQTPLQRLEHGLHLPVAFLVIPIFSLFNAGIPIAFGAMGETLSHPVTLGVMAGLVLGKFIGITGASWLALRFGLAQLPSNTRFSQIAAVSMLAGIGFTMSIFISELGFATQPEYLLMAKTGVLAASLLAGLVGFAWLWWLGRRADLA